jgi:hypothetical protein
VQHELAHIQERYTIRFRPIAAQWQQIIADYIRELAQTIEQRQEIESPYIVGVPLTAQQAIFVGRTDISAQIERLLLSRQCPPLLLYGQRRMGKTSLLNNMGRLLPSAIVPLFVDLQGPLSQANDHAGLLAVLARSMAAAAQSQRAIDLPLLTRQDLQSDPFLCFDEWLHAVERRLEPAVALLMLDEFEVLERALARGRFDEERVLGLLRHLIQHRSCWRVLLAGSHTLDELSRWASYLINVQVVHVGYLSEAETEQLVEHPVKDFALCYDALASQRVFTLTRGHPALVQLLCSEVVGLKNTQAPAVRRLARVADVEAAIPEVLRRGTFFFADIGHQAGEAGSVILRALATNGEAAVVKTTALRAYVRGDAAAPLRRLIQYELIEPIEDGYRFQVELIRRWFAR